MQLTAIDIQILGTIDHYWKQGEWVDMPGEMPAEGYYEQIKVPMEPKTLMIFSATVLNCELQPGASYKDKFNNIYRALSLNRFTLVNTWVDKFEIPETIVCIGHLYSEGS